MCRGSSLPRNDELINVFRLLGQEANRGIVCEHNLFYKDRIHDIPKVLKDIAEIFRFSEWDIRCMILLFCLEISAEHWSVGNKWHKENRIPYVQGERIYADDLYLLHVQG